MLFRAIKAMLRLIRPELPAAAGVCVVLGQAIALGGLPPIGRLALGFALGFCLSASQMVFNDYFDLEVDRINAPQRPLPSGQLSPGAALAYGSALALVAMLLAAWIDPIVLALSAVGWVLGFLYNWKLKSAGLWGNLIVALSVTMTFIIGSLSVGVLGNPLVWIFALLTGLFDLAEEIAGDAMDIEGDRARGSQSLAIRYGRSAALRASAGLFAAVVALTLTPYLLGERGLDYWLPILAIDLVIVVFTIRLARSRTERQGRFAMRVLYICASLGLLAFLMARFV